jgi:hypothetical protein
MDKGRGFKILFSVLLVVILGVAGTWYWFSNREVEDFSEVLGEEDFGKVPYITSLCPAVAYEEDVYECLIRFVDEDSYVEDISVEFDGPYWLEVEDMILRGVVPEGSEGTYKIVLRVSDGYNSSVQESYLLVEGND